MEAFEPVQGAGDQEALNLAPPEIVDVGVPVVVIALARIEMLIERGAVEARQPVSVGRKVRGHPVEQHADARLVGGIDEPGEGVRRAIPRRGREQAERLIAPRASERMLGDGQKFEMREAHLAQVGHEPLRQEIP